MNLTDTTIRKRWHDILPNPNFLTPKVLKLTQTHDEQYLYELSTGDDMHGLPMYGVTVVELTGYGRHDVHRHDLSRVFTGLKAKANADRYIRSGFTQVAQ